MSNIYKRLREMLDTISFGFPKSWLGIEKIGLKRIFSKKDAETFVSLKPGYQTPTEYAKHTGCSVEAASEKLEGMAKRGLLYRRHRGNEVQYRQMPFAFGLIEFQLFNPDTSWLLPMGAYIGISKFGKNMGATMPFYRTVPVHAELVQGSSVLPYDDVEAVLNRHSTFVVTTCVCRKLAAKNRAISVSTRWKRAL